MGGVVIKAEVRRGWGGGASLSRLRRGGGGGGYQGEVRMPVGTSTGKYVWQVGVGRPSTHGCCFCMCLGGAFAPRGHSANYNVVYPWNTPESLPPYRSVHDPFKTASGARNSGPWDRWLPGAKNSRLSAQRGHSARCARFGVPPMPPPAQEGGWGGGGGAVGRRNFKNA